MRPCFPRVYGVFERIGAAKIHFVVQLRSHG